MKKLIMISFIIIFLGCNSTKKVKNNSCQEYFNFIHSDWFYKEDAGHYVFKGNPKYWDREQYSEDKFVNEECLKSLSLKELKKLFGEPSKTDVYENDFMILTYCLSESCLTSKYPLKAITISVMKDGEILRALTSPTSIRRRN